MKKITRVLVIIVSSVILFYGVFVGVECVRLNDTATSKVPIIITKQTEIQGNKIKYTGLGYTITYEAREEKPISSTNQPVCGAEFRLFDEILLWAWIE